MTDTQRKALQRYWWPQAARAQAWQVSDRDLRLRVLSLAVSFVFADQLEFLDALAHYDQIRNAPPSGVKFRHLESANELNHTTDVDAVKNLLGLLSDNLKAANEHDQPELGHGRRQMSVLDEKILCLSQYPLDRPMGVAGARAYVQQILNDKFNRGQHLITLTLADLDQPAPIGSPSPAGRVGPSQKEQLLMTVNARLNGKTGFRAQAGHSVHDMLTGVGLPCACSRCLRSGLAGQAKLAGLVPPLQPPPAIESDPELAPSAVADPEFGNESGDAGDSPF